MALVESLQKAIDYMEQHLLDDISMEDIAKRTHLSPHHFQRTFVILTDISIGEYIRRRRLTKAAHELYNTDTKIIDLAYKYGYKTPESFTKALQKQHGITPSEARKGMGNIQSFNRLTIQVQLKGDKPMNYQLVERDAFQIVGVRKFIDCDEDFNQSSEIGLYWAKLAQGGIIDQLAKLNNGEISGLIGATVNYNKEKNQIEYWVGSDSSEDAPKGFLTYEIPSAKWAIFETVGPVREVVPETWKKIYSEWFPSNDFEPSNAPALEIYKTPDPRSPTAKTEIWVPIK